MSREASPETKKAKTTLYECADCGHKEPLEKCQTCPHCKEMVCAEDCFSLCSECHKPAGHCCGDTCGGCYIRFCKECLDLCLDQYENCKDCRTLVIE